MFPNIIIRRCITTNPNRVNCILLKQQCKILLTRYLAAQNRNEKEMHSDSHDRISNPFTKSEQNTLPHSHTDTENKNKDYNVKSNRKWLIAGAVIGTGILVSALVWSKNKEKEVASPRDVLMVILKEGVLATQKGNINEAQDLFHEGLQLAYEHHKKKIVDDQQFIIIQINIYSLMATLAVRAGDSENAEKLYKETMQKCLAAGRAQDDDSMIELSIKLASLYATMSRDEEAEVGFKFCVETMNDKVKKGGGVLESDTNTLALQGLALQSYARFLMKKKQHSKAVELYKKSLDIAREVYGADHPQALVVLNDLASAYVINRQYKEGIEAYKEAVTRAEKSEELLDTLVAFYYNLGEACILGRDYISAAFYCSKCSEVAMKIGNPSLISVGKQCLKDVVEVEAKEKSTKA